MCWGQKGARVGVAGIAEAGGQEGPAEPAPEASVALEGSQRECPGLSAIRRALGCCAGNGLWGWGVSGRPAGRPSQRFRGR